MKKEQMIKLVSDTQVDGKWGEDIKSLVMSYIESAFSEGFGEGFTAGMKAATDIQKVTFDLLQKEEIK